MARLILRSSIMRLCLSCRNTVSDPGWPPLLGCLVPAVDASFTARTRPGLEDGVFSFQF